MSQHGCPERLSNRSKGFSEEGPSQPTMEVLVETLTGTAFEMTVSPSDTVFAIKSKIYRVEGIPVSQQHLLYNLKELEDSCSLRSLSIGDGARLRLVLGMRGGPISTRRLPVPEPANSEPWPDIERLLDSNRDESEWSSGGCKVTVLVFRDGERVNMLRVKENCDGTYSPIDSNKFTPSTESESVPRGGEASDNALTMTKMVELRRRMEALALQRSGDKVEIQKTRSEETLSVSRLLDDPRPESLTELAPYEPADGFTQLYSDHCARYPCELSLGARCALLPAPATRARRRLAPRDYGVVGGWRGAGHSASALQLRAAPPPPRAPLSDSLFSSSTSELDTLQRHSGRMLGALSRHPPREHLHLSDEQLAAPVADLPHKKISRVRCGLCRKRLSVATEHRCRCGAVFCAPHRYAEVHGCAYDYKAPPPPPASRARLPRI